MLEFIDDGRPARFDLALENSTLIDAEIAVDAAVAMESAGNAHVVGWRSCLRYLDWTTLLYAALSLR